MDSAPACIKKVRVTSYLAIGQSTRSSTSYSSDTVPNLRRPRRYHFRPRKLDLPGAKKFQPLPTLHPKANFVHDTPSTETPTAMKLQTYYRNRKRMACAHPLLTLLINQYQYKIFAFSQSLDALLVCSKRHEMGQGASRIYYSHTALTCTFSHSMICIPEYWLFVSASEPKNKCG